MFRGCLERIEKWRIVRKIFTLCYEHWRMLLVAMIVLLAVLSAGSVMYYYGNFEMKEESIVWGNPYSDLRECSPPDQSYLPERVDLGYCNNHECRYVKHPKYDFKYREFVCPMYKGNYIKFKSVRDQNEKYYAMIEAFVEMIAQVETDIPLDERYFLIENAVLEVVREDGIPMPWHIDVDIGVDVEVLRAARVQGFDDRRFGSQDVHFDVNPQIFLPKEERDPYFSWGDDSGFDYRGTRLQIEQFRVEGDKIYYSPYHTITSFPKDWAFPTRKYKYLGFELNGPAKPDLWLEWYYGTDWKSPYNICDPLTRNWVKNGSVTWR